MKTVLMLLRPLRKSTGLRVDLRLADSPVADGYGVGGFEWEPAISKRPVLSLELMSPDMDGKVRAGKARFAVNLDNIKSVTDAMTLDYQGAPIEIWTAADLAWSRRRLEFVGNVAAAKPDVDTKILALDADVSVALLEKPLLTLEFTGGGGILGDAEKRGTLKPAGFGAVEHIEPVWFDETYNIGMIDGYGNTIAITRLTEGADDRGAAVANYASYIALRQAIIDKVVKPGQWATCVAEGLVGLGAPADGVIGVNATFGSNRPGSMMRRILETHAAVPIGSIDTAAFTALTAAVDRAVHYWTKDQRQCRDLLEAIAGAANATPLLSFQGMVTVTRNVASAAVATLRRDGGDEPRVLNWRAAESYPPFYRLRARAARPARVLTRDEVLFIDDFVPLGIWSASTSYRAGNTVFMSDGSEFVYIADAATAGNAPPTATSPPAAPAANAWWQQLQPPTNPENFGVARGAGTTFEFTHAGGPALKIVANSVTNPAPSAALDQIVASQNSYARAAYAEAKLSGRVNFGLSYDRTELAAQHWIGGVWVALDAVGIAPFDANSNPLTSFVAQDPDALYAIDCDGVVSTFLKNGAVVASCPVVAGQTFFLKAVFGQSQAGSVTKARFEKANSRAWSDTGGANRPADNATRNVNRGVWAAATAYAVGDEVQHGGITWYTSTAHTSDAGFPPGHASNTQMTPLSTWNYRTFLWRRSSTPPATPTGNNPADWSEGTVPPGTDRLWMVLGLRKFDGTLIGTWSAPESLSEFVPRNDYNAATAYQRLDAVTFGGGSYYALQATTGNAPTGTAQANTWWGVLAAPGPPGTPATPPSAFTATINIATTNGTVNLRTLADAAGYPGGDATLTFNVNNGITVRGLAGGIGVDTGTWPAGYTISRTLNVNAGGVVDGGGGNGGSGGSGGGAIGGDAIVVRCPITIANAGAIRGGGGGGGGGKSISSGWPEPSYYGGGGGGGGFPNGNGGGGGTGDFFGNDGSPGTTSGGGSGGAGAGGIAAPGGGGGGAGTAGANGSGPGGNGGAAGYSIRRNGHAVTYSGAGTKIGTDA